MDKRFKPMSAQERNAARRELSDELVRDPSISIPEAIKKIRKTMRMTIAEYAKVCDVAARSLSDIERGETSPTLFTVEKLLAPLGMRLAVLPAGQRDLNVLAQHSRIARTPDPVHINVHEKWELDYWAEKWNVQPEMIIAAIGALETDSTSAVRQYLNVKHQLPKAST